MLLAAPFDRAKHKRATETSRSVRCLAPDTRLNDYFAAGPALQSDLSLVLLNWRRFRYVFTADIVKMFRQIRVAPQDQDLQRVLWPPAARLDYKLTTVTYGTACAPYLAIRTLLQLARDERERFPLGAEYLETNKLIYPFFITSSFPNHFLLLIAQSHPPIITFSSPLTPFPPPLPR